MPLPPGSLPMLNKPKLAELTNLEYKTGANDSVGPCFLLLLSKTTPRRGLNRCALLTQESDDFRLPSLRLIRKEHVTSLWYQHGRDYSLAPSAA